MTRALLVVLGVAASARAQPVDQSRCPVELADDAPEVWQHAAEALRLSGAPDGECGLVRVEIARQPDGTDLASVGFVTSDGRSARRWIREPGELVTAVKLLRIAGAKAASPKSVDEQPAATTPPAARTPDVKRQPDKARGKTDGDASAHHAMAIGLHAGGRLAGRWSPALGANVAWTPGPWELGIAGAAEPRYTPSGNDETKPPYDSAVALSTFGGYRLALGSWEGVLQARLTLAAISAQTRIPIEVGATATNPSEGQPSAEFRTGVLVGAILPRGATTRLRGDLGMDLVLTRDAGIPLALSALVGVEFGLF